VGCGASEGGGGTKFVFWETSLLAVARLSNVVTRAHLDALLLLGGGQGFNSQPVQRQI
jgi:hypothetical protein